LVMGTGGMWWGVVCFVYEGGGLCGVVFMVCLVLGWFFVLWGWLVGRCFLLLFWFLGL